MPERDSDIGPVGQLQRCRSPLPKRARHEAPVRRLPVHRAAASARGARGLHAGVRAAGGAARCQRALLPLVETGCASARPAAGCEPSTD